MSSTNGNGHILSQDAFSAEVERRLEQQPEIEILSRSASDIDMRVRGLGVRASLEPFYTTYASHPEQFEMVISNFVEAALGFVPDRSIDDYDTLSERILPMLKPISILAEVRERKVPLLAYQLFLADLIVTYVIDEQQSVVYVNEEHMERWGVSERDLHEQAIANLRQRTVARDYTVAGDGGQRLFIWNTGDGYDATRLLLSDVLTQWQAQVDGNLVIGVPNRDFLVAFGDSDETILDNIARQVEADSTQRSQGLTSQLFTLQQGQVRVYEWE